MENCNYDRAEMMAFNLVRQGAIGEVLHAEGAWSMKLDGNPYCACGRVRKSA